LTAWPLRAASDGSLIEGQQPSSWETATNDYRRIEIPVLPIWGDQDWARPVEWEHDRMLIPGVEMTTLAGGGHFLPLDRPRELTEVIVRFAARSPIRA